MEQKLRDVVIVAYGRSPVAKAGKGALKNEHPVTYGAQVLKGVLDKVPGLPLEEIEDVVVGCAKPEQLQGSNVGRIIAQRAGLPDSVAGQTVNRFCASGLQAIATAAGSIMTGQADIVAAGGVEDMTIVPMGTKEEYREPWISQYKPGIYMSMGVTAENVAGQYGISREDMELFALDSHRKAAKAQDEGCFDKEIIPVNYSDDDGNMNTLRSDQGVRRNSTLEKLRTLEPCFIPNGKVTAATSSPTSDGAGFVIMMTEEKAEELNIKPVARFLSFAVAGVPADVMGLGPVKAVPKALGQAGLSIRDMDVIEINEAFAAQAIPCIRELGMNPEIVNPRGGALALGHPLGATGAILTCKALSYLEDTNGQYGLVCMCIGGGMGAAAVFENCRQEAEG